MVQIVVDAEKAKQILEAQEPVEILGPGGRLLGFVRRRAFTSEEVQAAIERAEDGGPWQTSAEVLSCLRPTEQQELPL